MSRPTADTRLRSPEWADAIEQRQRHQDARDDAASARANDLRTWWLEYDCEGRPYNWRGLAANESAADTVARHALQVRSAGFDTAKATLTVCLEC